ncbi:hypothetical protein MLOOGBEN_02585 [Bacillus sp. EB106-08-02-XG196]|uniref:hypothetical protein n=1 Tax=Bacillus sp. EB106-08-02-XG196 TaxID=2737049 RepID=UPI0015C44201|nr:hypothetical protein [Bacillus sp. EB106-08-02-XG196]NWQ39585.1 hypothetical protein [Bacillus sp. EB106-08-02-XG196]
MILIFYLIVNVLTIFLFIKMKKRLHILEILVYWMFSSYLFQNFSALCFMNFRTLIIPDKLTYEFAHFINRIVLYPAIMVTFLQFFIILNSHLKKLILLGGLIILLTGLEWLSDLLGVMNHVHWQLWWSFTFWLIALVVLIGLMKFFRNILYIGGWKH